MIMNGMKEELNENRLYYVETIIMEILIDIIGKKDSLILFFTKQELIVETLKNTPYKKTNLLKYLKQQLKKASIYNDISQRQLSSSANVINCCEALSDCKNKLSYKEKSKVYEKKFENYN